MLSAYWQQLTIETCYRALKDFKVSDSIKGLGFQLSSKMYFKTKLLSLGYITFLSLTRMEMHHSILFQTKMCIVYKTILKYCSVKYYYSYIVQEDKSNVMA